MQNKITSRPDQADPSSYAAVIVAAGSGVRAASTGKFDARQDGSFGNNNLGYDLPKQFWRLGDKPVVAHAFDYFHHHPAIAAIILVVAEPFITLMTNTLPKALKPVHLVAGGATRQESVHAGLTALAGLKDCKNIDYVAIHDAARPLIPTNLLDDLIAAIDKTNYKKQKTEIIGAVPVMLLADSIKTIDKNNSQNKPYYRRR